MQILLQVWKRLPHTVPDISAARQQLTVGQWGWQTLLQDYVWWGQHFVPFYVHITFQYARFFKACPRHSEVPQVGQTGTLPNHPSISNFSVAGARECPRFLFVLQGTVAWPKPALHHWKHLMIILRPAVWIKLPASCLSAEWKRGLESFGWARNLQFLCVTVLKPNMAWHRVKFIHTLLHCSISLPLLSDWQHYVN